MNLGRGPTLLFIMEGNSAYSAEFAPSLLYVAINFIRANT